ncbi:MAG TPA: Rnase Y domain-containing protein, partial [Thermoanaerobaculia bacterium]
MNASIAIPIAAAIVAVVFALFAYFLLRAQVRRERSDIRVQADRVLADANKAAEARLREAAIEAKERVLAAQAEFDRNIQVRRGEVAVLEKRVGQKEENLDRKLAQQEKREEEFARKERALADAQKGVERAHADVQKLIEDQQKRLEQISGLTAADAKRDLIRSIENEARVDAAGLMRRIEEEAVEQATQKARHQIGMAIQRLASDTVVEATVSVVELPSDDLKGRIIGREGRNIRALEAATGVDLII